MKRIGLLGGTFDPVHMGHLQSASLVKEQFDLDEMRLLPLSVPVHKSAPIANEQQRLHCLQLALKQFPDLQIDSTEFDRQGSSYTVDTLIELRKQNPKSTFYWLMGMDAFEGFSKWKEPEKILELANIIVINRPSYIDLPHANHDYGAHIKDNKEIAEYSHGAITFFKVPPMAVSSTELREMLLQNPLDQSLLTLIPEPILHYIQKEKIYAKERETMNLEELKNKIIDALEEVKGIDITVLEVGEMTSVADYLIVASGRSDRQVKSLANNVQVKLKESDIRPLGVEGEREGQWVLIDYADILVHIMMPDVRDFYNLEKLWEERPSKAQQV